MILWAILLCDTAVDQTFIARIVIANKLQQHVSWQEKGRKGQGDALDNDSSSGEPILYEPPLPWYNLQFRA